MKNSVHDVRALEIAKELKITVKNVKTFKGHEGMTGMNADIYVNGIKSVSVYDDARGGGMEMSLIGKMTWKDIQAINDKLKSEPELECGNESYSFTLGFDFESIANAVVDTEINAKEIKRDSKKGIMYQEGSNTLIMGWKVSIPTMLKKYKPESIVKELQKMADEVKADGKEILNKEYLESIGLKL